MRQALGCSSIHDLLDFICFALGLFIYLFCFLATFSVLFFSFFKVPYKQNPWFHAPFSVPQPFLL